MKTLELDTRESNNKWWSIQDARMKSIANASHYTEAEKVTAERMKLGLDMVYFNHGIHINYRQKFITIKIDKPKVRDSKTLKLLESDYEKLGVQKLESNQGVIYRIPKK